MSGKPSILDIFQPGLYYLNMHSACGIYSGLCLYQIKDYSPVRTKKTACKGCAETFNEVLRTIVKVETNLCVKPLHVPYFLFRYPYLCYSNPYSACLIMDVQQNF